MEIKKRTYIFKKQRLKFAGADCGNSDFCFLFKDAKHEFILPLEQIVFCLFVCKEEHVIVDTYPNFWMLMFNSYPSLQNLITENNYEMRDYERKVELLV